MKLGKNKNSPQIEHAVGKAVNYEVTVADIARRSERRAWMVAFGAIIMSLILAGGYFYMLPLKEKVPYLIMADAYTGNATVARLQGDVNNNRITSSEAINKANVAAFIRARESYDSTLIWERDWKTLFAMAEPQVSSTYKALYSARNPGSPSKIYGKNQSIRVKILSIQLIAGNNGPRGATVRFQRSLVDKASGGSRLLDNKIATLEYTYKSNLAMNEDTRMLNPLGFRVTAYRVDNDYSTMPAPPSDDAMAAPTDAQVPGAEMPMGPEEMPSMELPPGAAPAAGPAAAPGYPNAPAAAPAQGYPPPAGAAAAPGAYPAAPAGAAYPAPNNGAPANAAYPPAGAANQANGVRTR